MSDEVVMYRFKWWYKGKSPEGIIVSYSGYLHAIDDQAACDAIEKLMRRQYPDIQWMQGNRIESSSVRFGPTVQRLKRGKRMVKS